MGNVIMFMTTKQKVLVERVEQQKMLIRINELEHALRFAEFDVKALREAGKELGGPNELAAAELIKEELAKMTPLYEEMERLKKECKLYRK